MICVEDDDSAAGELELVELCDEVADQRVHPRDGSKVVSPHRELHLGGHGLGLGIPAVPRPVFEPDPEVDDGRDVRHGGVHQRVRRKRDRPVPDGMKEGMNKGINPDPPFPASPPLRFFLAPTPRRAL